MRPPWARMSGWRALCWCKCRAPCRSRQTGMSSGHLWPPDCRSHIDRIGARGSESGRAIGQGLLSAQAHLQCCRKGEGVQWDARRPPGNAKGHRRTMALHDLASAAAGLSWPAFVCGVAHSGIQTRNSAEVTRTTNERTRRSGFVLLQRLCQFQTSLFRRRKTTNPSPKRLIARRVTAPRPRAGTGAAADA
jgi:hypothetical protein